MHPLEKEKVDLEFWLPHPSKIDTMVLWEKIIHYLLNPNHKKGGTKYPFFKLFGFTDTLDSAHRIITLFCELLLEQDSIYRVDYTASAIKVTYIEIFNKSEKRSS